MPDKKAIFRSLPGVDKLLEEELVVDLLQTVPRELVMRAIRDVLEETRKAIGQGEIIELIDCDDIVQKALLKTNQILRSDNQPDSNFSPGFHPVEASGINTKLSILMNILTGAEETISVNSMANAVQIALESLKTKESEDKTSADCLLVPSTDLIHVKELGYLEEMITASGFKIIETGCTNRIHLKDLKKALEKDDNTIRAILLSDKPNTKTLGFTKNLDVGETAKLAREYKIPLIIVHWRGTTGNSKAPANLADNSSTSIRQYISNGAKLVISPTNFDLGGFEGAVVSGTSTLISKLKTEKSSSTIFITPALLNKLEEFLYEELKTIENKDD